MGNVMRIGGKADNNTVKGVSVSNDGYVRVEREWKVDATVLMQELEIRDTNAHWTNENGALDVSDYAFVSIRVNSSLDADVNVVFGEDTHNLTTSLAKDAQGVVIGFSIPANTSGYFVYTPNDIPFLAVVRRLSFRVTAQSAPTKGDFSITVYAKR